MNQIPNWSNVVGIAFLGLTVIATIIGASVIVASGKPIPEGFFALGTTAVGALGALLYSNPSNPVKPNEQPHP